MMSLTGPIMNQRHDFYQIFFKYKKTESTDVIQVRIKSINKRLWEVIGYLFLFTLIDFFYFAGL